MGFEQESFAAGELGPRLWGRHSDAAYGQGVRRLRNMLVTKEGAAASRPGMRFCGPVRDFSTTARLVPFVYSDSFAYVLELTPGHLRLWHDGALVVDGGALPIDLATPYTADELRQLRFAVSGDVVFITHGNHTTRKLTRLGHASWTLTTVSFAPRAGFYHYTPPAVYAPGGAAALAGTVAQPAQQWRWCVTTVARLADGTLYESEPTHVTGLYTGMGTGRTGEAALPGEVAVYQDKPVTISWANPGLVPSPVGFTVQGWRVYRGTGNRRGLVGEAGLDAGYQFIDFGREPDYAHPPPQGRNPFDVYEPGYAGSAPLLRTEEPSCVAFHEERLAFARSVERPAYWWLSTIGDYLNFDERLPATEDSAIEGELTSRQREEVRSLLSHDKALLAFTDAAVWTLYGEGAPLTYTSLVQRRKVAVGANWAEPVAVGDDVLYARTKGRGLQLLTPSEEGANRKGVDASARARHLFAGTTVVELAYQEDPWSVVWAVLSNGLLLSFTFSRETSVAGWAWHDTGVKADGSRDSVVSVCCVPEGDEDAVYLVVSRLVEATPGTFLPQLAVERMKGFELDDTADVTGLVCMDAARQPYSAVGTTVTADAMLGVGTLACLADGNVVTPVPVDPLAPGEWTLPEEAGAVWMGHPFTPQLETLDVPASRRKAKAVEMVMVDVTASRGLWLGEDSSRPDTFTEWQQRTGVVGALPLATQRVEHSIRNSWNKGGRVCLEQRAPLPLTVYAIEREVKGGG